MSRHDRLPSNRLMGILRRNGEFRCTCSVPEPQWLPLWQAFQCGTCAKPIFEQLVLPGLEGDA